MYLSGLYSPFTYDIPDLWPHIGSGRKKTLSREKTWTNLQEGIKQGRDRRHQNQPGPMDPLRRGVTETRGSRVNKVWWRDEHSSINRDVSFPKKESWPLVFTSLPCFPQTASHQPVWPFLIGLGPIYSVTKQHFNINISEISGFFSEIKQTSVDQEQRETDSSAPAERWWRWAEVWPRWAATKRRVLFN